jgi:hypothetical protein
VTAPAADLETGDEDESGLEIRARRKSWGPNYVRFGLNLEDDFQGNSQYNAAARFILTEINALGAESLTDVQIGSNPKVVSEFYQPLDALRNWFVAPSARIEVRDLPIYTNNEEVADFAIAKRRRTWTSDAISAIGARFASACIASTARRASAMATTPADADLVEQQYNEGEFFFKFSSTSSTTCISRARGRPSDSMGCGPHRLGFGLQARPFDGRLVGGGVARAQYLLWWTSAGTTLDGYIKPTRCRSSIRWADFSIYRASRRAR